jgi:hypothetical protein
VGVAEQRVEFVGFVSGVYDLRDALEHADGSPADDLEPLHVRIFSQLPPDHGTDVYGLTSSSTTLAGRYRSVLMWGGVAWLSIPGFVLIRRAMKRKPILVVPPPVRAPTLAEELCPLVQAAHERPLTVPERGRLELLLYQYWQEHLGMTGMDQAGAMRALRADAGAGAGAGAILRAVERWLHHPGDGKAPRETPDESVMALLEPFRSVRLSSREAEVRT